MKQISTKRYCIQLIVAFSAILVCSAADSYDLLFKAVESVRNDEMLYKPQAREIEACLALLKTRDVCEWNADEEGDTMKRMVTTLQFYVCGRTEFPTEDVLEPSGYPCYFFDHGIIGETKKYEDLLSPATKPGALSIRTSFLRIAGRSTLDILIQKDPTLLNLSMVCGYLDDLAATDNLGCLTTNEYHNLVRLFCEVEQRNSEGKETQFVQSTGSNGNVGQKFDSVLLASEMRITTLRYFESFMAKFVAASLENQAPFIEADKGGLDKMLNEALMEALQNIATLKSLSGHQKKEFALSIARLAALPPREDTSGAQTPMYHPETSVQVKRAVDLLDEVVFGGDISGLKLASSNIASNKESLAVFIASLARISSKNISNPEALSFVSAKTINLCQTIRDSLFDY